MRRICLIIEYDGTDFAGWQRQNGQNSIQEEIEKNIEIITKEKSIVHGSGRTDSGVHAFAQVAHFDTAAKIPAEKFALALNTGLPRSIRIHKSFQVPSTFHARFEAKRKHYRYTIENSPIPSAIYRNFRAHVYTDLNIQAMQKAAALLLGKHDFASFTTSVCTVKDTVRELYQSSLRKEGSLIYYDVEGNGFLYNMVRIIVGTLIEIGQGRREIADIQKLLLWPDRYANAGATAKAQGLMLMRVDYPEFDEFVFKREEANR